MRVGYFGQDQYGEKFILTSKHPRKELLDQLDRKHADKMYTDTKSGETKHIGYIIGGHWITLYEVHEWRGKCL